MENKETLYILKIGGHILDQPDAFSRCVEQISCIRGKKIIVHGGGKFVDKLANDLHITQQKIDGRRITSEETLDLALMVYAGMMNKKIVARLNALKLKAIGLSGADNACITATRRPAVPVDYGLVGDVHPSGVKIKFISSLIHRNLLPVFSSITMSREGELLNTNADTIASVLSVALSESFKTTLVYCFEKPGVLLDFQDDSSVIPYLDAKIYAELKTRSVFTGGMLPKLQNAFKALECGVNEVIITKEDKLTDVINGSTSAGTRLFA